MTVEIAGITFDHVSYDREGDVLYLHVGDPSTAVEFNASPEGHALRYDGQGRRLPSVLRTSPVHRGH